MGTNFNLGVVGEGCKCNQVMVKVVPHLCNLATELAFYSDVVGCWFSNQEDPGAIPVPGIWMLMNPCYKAFGLIVRTYFIVNPALSIN